MPFSRDYTLPKDPIFSRLVEQLKECDQRVILDDRNRGLEVSYHQLLHGTVRLREKLREVLDCNDLARPGTFFIAVLAPNSYEFIISLLAVLAIGGVVVPIRESSSLWEQLAFNELTLNLWHNSNRRASS